MLYATIKFTNMEKIKAAQIGFGKWGKKLALVVEKYFDLSIVDRENFSEYLKDPKVRAVFIATPIDTHFDIALRALQSGKHVFLEKPGTDSSDKLKILTEEADRRDLVLQIGYEFTFAPDIAEMKSVLENEKVSKVRFEWHKWGSFDFHPVINLLVHELSILKTIGIWPINITKYEERDGEYHPDSIHIEAKHNDIEITFDIDRTSEIKEKIITIESAKGRQEWRDIHTSLVDDETMAFASAIAHGTKPLPDGHFAEDILRTIESIPYRAS